MAEPLRFVGHARQRCAERGVTDDMVEWVLSHPIGPPDAGDPGKLAYCGYVHGGRKPVLKVVVSASDTHLVISVMWRVSP